MEPPRTVEVNVAWRRWLMDTLGEHPEFVEGVNESCRRNILLWIDGFAWTYDPRTDIAPRPFVLWDFQRDVVMEMHHAILVGEDRLIEKSRDMGLTWMFLAVYAWFWLFVPDSPFLISSRVEDLVDRQGDPDCLFWKLDYLITSLPPWQIPRYRRTFMHLGNLQNGSVIDGAAANNVGRGGRRKGIALDEHAQMVSGTDASTADCSPSRFFISTPHGVGNEFADIKRKGNTRVLSLHWTRHPFKGKGKHRAADGTWTSPWYERECNRRASLRDIAQELDIDYLSSGDMFFDAPVLTRIQGDYVKAPGLIGELEYHWNEIDEEVQRIAFVQRKGGPLRLWEGLDSENHPGRTHNYVLGADIATGQGASNSILSIANTTTHEKVAEWASPYIAPHDLARVAFALGRWYGGNAGYAFIVHEANGPGLIFGRELLKLGYPFVYFHKREAALHAKSTDIPGWHSSRENKRLLLQDLRRSYARNDFINRSEESIREAFEYIYFPNGSIGPSSHHDLTTGARETHGDRVIADALCVLGFIEMPKAPRPPERIPSNCFFERRRAALKSNHEEWRWS